MYINLTGELLWAPYSQHTFIHLYFRENEDSSLKTNYGYVRMQRVPSFRKMNQDLRKQQQLDLQKGQLDQRAAAADTGAARSQAGETGAAGGRKDSALQRKLQALCFAEDTDKDSDNGGESEPQAQAIRSQAAGENQHTGTGSEQLTPAPQERAEKKRVQAHHQRTNSYELAIDRSLTPVQEPQGVVSQDQGAGETEICGPKNPEASGRNTVGFSTSQTYHEDHGRYENESTHTHAHGFGMSSATNTAYPGQDYEASEPEDPPHRHYTYDQRAVPVKGILKKSKDAPHLSYSFDSYDQERGFAISVHNQSQDHGDSSQDFFQKAAAGSIPRGVIPEPRGEMEQPPGGTKELDSKRVAQMEAEMNGLYQPYQEPETVIRTEQTTPVHRILLESERYRNLYNSSKSSQFLMENSNFTGDAFDTSDTMHRKQMRQVTEQMYGSVGGRSSPQGPVRARSPSPQPNNRTRGRNHSPSLRQAAQSHAFAHASAAGFRGSLEEVPEDVELDGVVPGEPIRTHLHREDSVTSSSSSLSSMSIYERYNVPLDNALLYRTNASPNIHIRPPSPGGTSDASTNVDSGFNDTFDGFLPQDGGGATARPGSHHNPKPHKVSKLGNKILSSSGLNILSSHKQQMDDEYNKYLKLLGQVQSEQKQQRRTSAPVISHPLGFPAGSVGSLQGQPQQQQQATGRPRFVKTADLFRMMQQNVRPPTPPVKK